MTRYGKQILACLREAGGHLTAEEIFLLVRQEEPGIVLATVYNNLNRLCQAGEVRRVSVSGQTDRFDGTVARHDHLVCDRCGQISDVVIQDLFQELEQRTQLTLRSYELNLHYICPACRASQQQAGERGREPGYARGG